MTTAINWEPFIFTIEIFFLFIGMCFFAAVGDVWFKGGRRSAKAAQPTALVNGEKVYLN